MTTSTSLDTYNTPLVPAATANFIVAARHTCNAPAALVFRTLRNTETWRDWNRFCPRVTIRWQPDDSDEREAMEYWTAKGGHFGSPAAAAGAMQQVHVDGTERRRSSQQQQQQQHLLEASQDASSAGKQKSTDTRRASSIALTKSLQQMGGEPSVRLKNGTKMTFHVRMKLPYKLTDYTDSPLVVTEVSRPNDPVNDDYSLTAMPTHTDAGTSGIYRISWALDPDKGIGRGGYPKSMLQGQRVHEIRPIVDEAGKETSCEIVTWECQKGILAKVVKGLYGKYMQERFEEWVKSLGDYCEEFAGKVDRRDFGVPAVATTAL
jgi:hypothetical protein